VDSVVSPSNNAVICFSLVNTRRRFDRDWLVSSYLGKFSTRWDNVLKLVTDQLFGNRLSLLDEVRILTHNSFTMERTKK